ATLTTGAIVNNVFYQPQTAGVLFEGATTSNVVVQYNLTMGGTATTGSGAGVTMSHNLDNTDPKLVNAPAFNLQLLVGSPAIDGATWRPGCAADAAGCSASTRSRPGPGLTPGPSPPLSPARAPPRPSYGSTPGSGRRLTALSTCTAPTRSTRPSRSPNRLP